MQRWKLSPLSLAFCALGLLGSAAHAQFKEPDVVKIGFITDMSSLYADVEGRHGATAIQMAIDDFGGKVLGKPIELLTADHQNKADIAASKAREWIDQQNISLVFGGTNSATALAMAQVATEKKRVFVDNGAGTSVLTNEQCSPYIVHYAFDTVALAKGTGKAVVENGGKTWFFLTADYAFGHALEADTTKIVEANGGKVLGAVKTPLNASDFSSFMLQAQNSKAQILGLANAGGDTVNSIKAAKEFGIDKAMKPVGNVMNKLPEEVRPLVKEMQTFNYNGNGLEFMYLYTEYTPEVGQVDLEGAVNGGLNQLKSQPGVFDLKNDIAYVEEGDLSGVVMQGTYVQRGTEYEFKITLYTTGLKLYQFISSNKKGDDTARGVVRRIYDSLKISGHGTSETGGAE